MSDPADLPLIKAKAAEHRAPLGPVPSGIAPVPSGFQLAAGFLLTGRFYSLLYIISNL